MKRLGISIMLAVMLIAAVPFVVAEERGLLGVDARVGVDVPPRVQAQERICLELCNSQENESCWDSCINSRIETRPAPPVGVGVEGRARGDLLGPVRVVTRAEVREAQENFAEARARFAEARADYREQHQEFVQLRAEVRAACADDGSAEDCNTVQVEILARAKAFLLTATDEAIAHLEQVKARVEASDAITDEEAVEIVADIDASIAALEEAKIDVEAATTQAELRDARQEILRVWAEAKHEVRVHTSVVIDGRVRSVVAQFQVAEDRLTCGLEAMADAGVDTTETQVLVDSFSANVDTATEAYVSAHALLDEAKASDDREERARLTAEARAEIRVAHTALRTAHEAARSAMQNMRAAGVDLSACAAE